ncbi:Ceramide very long chain fatty acid hydroxylase scs7 [Schizosaccharomyces pombe]|uniref:Ceramide very long chain fatty acid hydroxylase scs7 n=1 Tax=Schizosaccharomyces pombe (strain 972 / ATCC 24843) TaxID=284812 RepID=SCS7_SCHPO|nr:sphingosine hydroxylase Scs7 [Schizosaccharomyces pombe]O13846.1 RecName: Full=Ceramide very long chain fatty acid hydroxylase scs7; Short=Ceramide VLCFA hydroxylase scs7 [Schizosaccharomyces pombe 972h-]CAB10119.1 sphingosine hydroxylase Scs7 [Schizosaccharomyces pombe]|eukprot:NP_594423.1 sphingosine hydroxylase Scs7 [Schizosaccharomyces pombe]
MASVTSEKCVILSDGTEYDVTNYLVANKDAADLLRRYHRQEVADILNATSKSKHSEAVVEILKSAKVPLKNKEFSDLVDQNIGVGYGNEFIVKPTDLDKDFEKNHFLDLKKPLLPQILFGNIKKDVYLDQVHRPRHYRGSGSAPLFGNFLEPLTKTPWYMIPLIWVPCVTYGFLYACTGIPFSVAITFFIIGLFTWTLVEYTMHRFLFHLDEYTPDHPIFLTMHFAFHGCHHFLPADKYRLVMPPALFLIFATPWYHFIQLVLPHYIGVAGFSGAILGYVFYDLTHYFLHHRRMPNAYLTDLKTWHLDHHYKDYKSAYGITSWFWDRVFGTEGPLFNEQGKISTKAK